MLDDSDLVVVSTGTLEALEPLEKPGKIAVTG